jgi:hypothetical protein
MKKKQDLLIGIIFLVIFAIFACSIGNIPRVLALNTTNQTNVTVQVTGLTQITVSPTNLTWGNINPGTTGGIKYLDIINSGSINISTVYGYADTLTSEPNNPILIGVPSSYSSGGVITFKLNQTGAANYYVDRLEWNISKPTSAGGANCADALSWGYYRNASLGFSDYLWCIKNGTAINVTNGTGCNSTGSQFFIETEADVGEPLTRQPDISGGTVNGQTDWGIFNVSSGSLAGHCIATYIDCTKILIYKYDKRTSPNFATCNSTANLRDVTLTPGSQFSINLDSWVPQGVPAGWLASSWLTIEAGS